MIPLVILEAKLLKITALEGTRWTCRVDASFEDCDGIEFLCPLCFLANHGRVGTHAVICWKPTVPADISPGPGRWGHTGTGLGDLSLVAGSSSVALTGGCAWHGFVQNGYAHTDLSDERVAQVRAMYPREKTCIGHRVPGFDWHTWAPGDYGYWYEGGYWVAITPNDHAANLSGHGVQEHEDGTITVSPSIAVSTSREGKLIQVYHGFLERGVWRDA